MVRVGRRRVQLSERRRRAFLDGLAGCCDVQAAALAAGVDPAQLAALRRRDPGFAAEWQDAIAASYDLLETRLVNHFLAGGGDGIDMAAAFRLLADRRRARTGAPRRATPRRATSDETDKAILRKLDALDRKRRDDGGAAD